MIKLHEDGVFLLDGNTIVEASLMPEEDRKKGRKETITYSILKSHNLSDDMENLKIRFDSLASHDLTFVNIIQSARASNLKKFPVPYVLTCCHNSLGAVGGTINSDDHLFGLTSARKYGGIFVPPHISIIHQYVREMMAGCGKMILGSDSHTRYGVLGTMGVGEGGGELVKQILSQTWDIKYPEVVCVYLDGKPNNGVGPMDIAIALVTAVFKNGFVKNKVMEFVGPGVSSMSADYRIGIDVMTTETACLSSIWRTDEETRKYLQIHKRENEYAKLDPGKKAYYDSCIYIDLSAIHSMIALPFHPSNGIEIREFNKNPEKYLAEVEQEAKELFKKAGVTLNLQEKIHDGGVWADQGEIAGCSGGTYSNLMEAAEILKDKGIGNGRFALSIYPGSQPIMSELLKNGAAETFVNSGAILRSAICGPCFGAGETPVNNGLSLRHATRNFPNREGSKPNDGQLSAVALMDARSLAATAANGGKITAADELNYEYKCPDYHFDDTSYRIRNYFGFGKAIEDEELVLGPNIKQWPEFPALKENMLIKMCAVIEDAVTTTDELIPSGETSSFRSNPIALSEFTLKRRVPGYVAKAKKVMEDSRGLENGKVSAELEKVIETIRKDGRFAGLSEGSIGYSSSIFANRPGDGSAREQAASCQRVLLAGANIAREYATKRYRSNLINWGIIPFVLKDERNFEDDEFIFVPEIEKAIDEGISEIQAYIVRDSLVPVTLHIDALNRQERDTILKGCLINYYRK